MDHAQGAAHHRRIVLRGFVQGVGFRPFVLRAAERLGVTGSVRNAGGAVVVQARGTRQALALFLEELRQGHGGAWIADAQEADIPPFEADGFEILPSEGEAAGDAFARPDIGICPDCLGEIKDAGNRRYRYPFNSCVHCGPRYSIMEKLPYDRENTSMVDFPLCEECEIEYADISDRRCHAQTVGCHRCGPQLRWADRRDEGIQGEEAFLRAVSALKQGNIVAIKGVGGYHFACVPTCEEALAALRRIKGRDAKPFAVMLRDECAVEDVCLLSEQERKLLTSDARPIVLLELKQNPPFAPSLLCGEDRCGCFLPYTALHALLLEEFPALALTSANPGGAAIFTQDEETLQFFQQTREPRFAGVLYHDRRIVRAAEDSVVQLSHGHTQTLRSARGYAPRPVAALKDAAGADILALGGDLKAAACVKKGGFFFLGPYQGDLAEASVHRRFRDCAREMCSLLRAKPSLVACDAHPGYFSSTLAEEWGLPVVRVQHHHAHIASVMAEHRLGGKVIGVALDGTGYGADGGVWGGEFLICEGGGFRREGHLQYTAMLGGDALALDAKKTAFAYLWSAGAIDRSSLDASEKIMAAGLASGVNTVKCSSMGRLFDAAAAILGVAIYNHYEGQCAVLLQRCAQLALKRGEKPYPLRFAVREEDGTLQADGAALLLDIHTAAREGRAGQGALALGFHHAVAEMTAQICGILGDKENCAAVALSGGVFQNGLLLGMALESLQRRGFDVYLNQAVPPNDGGIALGQAYIGGILSCV